MKKRIALSNGVVCDIEYKKETDWFVIDALGITTICTNESAAARTLRDFSERTTPMTETFPILEKMRSDVRSNS